ncbi:MAG: molybdopterin-binding protein [Phascolarctobacterium sp.]|uniref:molybdopterin-binding protein n=1 Tax=Phascolarctobacterium sp. TaxID=2049039 RepID=UPI0026DAABA6|nr:molybdopterin-binding protein [Phascolarctobacterium sp.]MDO4921527.1 molybdopterin-binding protein [Phascolarctobacterium sp.]
MKLIKTEDAVGSVLCHDLTQIIRGVTKDAVFHKGHVVREEDIPVLLSIGKEHLYVWEADENMLHENDAARILCAMCKNDGMTESDIKEGKIELSAAHDGLFKLDGARLRLVNGFGQMMIATRHGNTPVKKGDKLAGMRIIPLIIEKEKMAQAQSLCGAKPLLQLLPYKLKTAAVIATGSEVFTGRIKDTFTPVIVDKLAEYGVEVIYREVLGDDPDAVTTAVKRAIEEKGAELVCCTGGMSVDPDDRTPLAIKNTGARIVSYGSPVLPGAMFLLAYYGERQTPVMGLPGCVMYAKRTIFDLALPRVLACDPITADELASLGEGGLCLNCPVCTYPACGFGKGW